MPQDEGKADAREIAAHEQTTMLGKSWFSSPWMVALVGSPLVLALFGLLAASITTTLQGIETNRIERMKFEYSLIQDALKTEYVDEAAQKLQFLISAGVISALDGDKIRKLADAHQLPIFAGAAIKYHLVSPAEAKELLAGLGLYKVK